MSVFRRPLWGLLLGLLACGCIAAGPSLTTADVDGQRLSHRQGLALAALWAGPSVGAPAAILYDVDADRILFERDAHQRRSPASTTKLATAIVALRRLSLTQVLTAGPEVAVEGMRVGLTPGDSASVEKLMYGLLLTSGNDAAMTLAAGTGGSVAQFVDWMNDLVAELGLKDTHFMNPHGLDEQGHYSSAYDLLILAREALKNPIIARLVATPRASLDGWNFINRNELLGQYPGVDGVKTGTSDEAGECLVASATRDGHRVLLVVLGSSDRYADARALLDYYYAHYTWRPLDLPANRFGMWTPDPAGRFRYLTLDGTPQAFLERWRLPWLSYRVAWDDKAGAGVARFWAGSELVGEAPLYLRTP